MTAKPLRTCTRLRALTLAIAAGAAAPAAFGEVIDIDRIVTDRLKSAGKLTQIQRDLWGADSPPPTTATFAGTVLGKRVLLLTQPSVAKQPLVIDEKFVCNRGTTSVQNTVTVRKTTTALASFSNTDAIQSALSFQAGLRIPVPGAPAEFFDVTLRQTGTSKTDIAGSEASDWEDTQAIATAPGQAQRVQYVVNEEKYATTRFTASLVLTGAIKVRGGAEGFSWVRPQGNVPPPNIVSIKQGRAPNGARYPEPGICRTLGLYGKWYAGTCHANSGTGRSIRKSDADVEVLVGSSDAVRTVGPYEVGKAWNPDNPDEKGRRICLTDVGFGVIPGYASNGACLFELNDNGFANASYVLLAPPAGGGSERAVPLENYLTEGERTIDFKGEFAGTKHRSAYFSTAPLPLSEAYCPPATVTDAKIPGAFVPGAAASQPKAPSRTRVSLP